VLALDIRTAPYASWMVFYADLQAVSINDGDIAQVDRLYHPATDIGCGFGLELPLQRSSITGWRSQGWYWWGTFDLEPFGGGQPIFSCLGHVVCDLAINVKGVAEITMVVGAIVII
jgi:hypothetical protein